MSNKLNGILAVAAVLTPMAAVPAVAAGPANLVTNGNFELGNTGFKSDYHHHSYPSADPSHGTGHDNYELGTDPKLDNNTWYATGDHTSGSGNFMLVDGSSTGTARVWYEKFNVVQGQQYILSAWAVNFLNKNNPNLVFTINGNEVGPTTSLGTAGTWQNLYTKWIADTTTVTFAVVDKQTATSGNDFGLDDISFKLNPVPEASTVVTFGLLFLGGVFTLRKRSQKANA